MAHYPANRMVPCPPQQWQGVVLPTPQRHFTTQTTVTASQPVAMVTPTMVRATSPVLQATPHMFMAGNIKIPITVAELEKMDLKTLYDVAAVLREEHANLMKDEDFTTQKLKELDERYNQQTAPDLGPQIQNLREGQIPKLAARRKAIEDTYSSIEKVHRRKKEEHGNRASTPQELSSPQSQYQAPTPGPTGFGRSAIKPNEPEGENPVLFKRKLNDLMVQVDIRQKLDEDVEDLLVEFAEEFIEDVVKHGCMLAHHRNSALLEANDVTLHMARKWNVANEKGDPDKRSVRPKLYINRPFPLQRSSMNARR